MANIMSGFAGGIPATAALARTALNIRSGGHSRVSITLNAIFTLMIVAALLPIFSYLPLPVVAALLFQVAIGMIEIKHIKKMWQVDKIAFILTIIVALLCIFMEPTTGIVVGAVFGMLRFADSISAGHSEIIIRKGDDILLHVQSEKIDDIDRSEMVSKGYFSPVRLEKIFEEPKSQSLGLAAMSADKSGETILIYRLIAKVTYVNVPQHVNRLKRVTLQGGRFVIMSFEFLFLIDADGLEALEEIEKELKHNGKLLLLSDIQTVVYPILLKSDWFKLKRRENHVFATTSHAISFCQRQMQTNPQLVFE